ncbi:Cyclin-dependent protein kinase inhibitor SMR9 [Euphorbia peplus]|nr:Cyclin-dependent protein kinase inhibitor SMR9 [Euphorbia peplus]
MAPSARRKAKPKTTTATTKKPTRTHFKKQQINKDVRPELAPPSTVEHNLKIDHHQFDLEASTCSTPKAQKFRIPKIETCPPAPMKQRVIPSCSLTRRSIAFFAPPDLELFFYFALGDHISV